jgi:hypothetical protein
MPTLLLVIGLVLAQAEPVRFLPDDAQAACRAILPQCFRRSDWAELCDSQSEIRLSFPEACQAAQQH